VSDVPELSIIIPAFNEEARLPRTLAAVSQHLRAQLIPYEVVVVDDGSIDATSEVAKAAGRQDPSIRLILTHHRGKGYAIRSGMLAARGSRRVFLDADLPMPVEDITRLTKKLENSPIVIASREGPGAQRIDEPAIRHFMGRIFNLLVRSVALPDIQDSQCGLKCFTADSAEALFGRQTIDGFGFDVEILYLAQHLGYRVQEERITWYHRPSSRVDPLRDTFRMVGDLLRVRWNDRCGRYREVQRARREPVYQPEQPAS